MSDIDETLPDAPPAASISTATTATSNPNIDPLSTPAQQNNNPTDPTPPGSQQATPMKFSGTLQEMVGGNGSGLGSGNGQGGFGGKRGMEEAQQAEERLMDRGFEVKWAGDVVEEGSKQQGI